MDDPRLKTVLERLRTYKKKDAIDADAFYAIITPAFVLIQRALQGTIFFFMYFTRFPPKHVLLVAFGVSGMVQGNWFVRIGETFAIVLQKCLKRPN